MRDSILGGSNPFVDLKAPERTQNFDVNIGGAIVPNKSSFSVFMGGRKQFDTPVATYTTDAGKQSALLGRRPNDGWNVNGMLRLRPDEGTDAARRLLAELLDAQQSRHRRIRSRRARVLERNQRQPAARAGDRADRQERVPEYAAAAAPLPHRLASQLEAPTIRVLDGFTSGGAQVTGGVNQKDVELSSDLNYVRGMHTMRTGIELEGRHYRTDSASNYLGTYIFSNGEDFQNRQAAQLHAPRRRSADHRSRISRRPSTCRTICGCGRT